MEQDAPKRITIDQLAAMMANGFAEVRDQFATMENHLGDIDTRFVVVDQQFSDVNKRIDTLSYKVDQLDVKLEAHRQETRDGFVAVRAVMSGISHTLSDHEERIKELEGE